MSETRALRRGIEDLCSIVLTLRLRWQVEMRSKDCWIGWNGWNGFHGTVAKGAEYQIGTILGFNQPFSVTCWAGLSNRSICFRSFVA